MRAPHDRLRHLALAALLAGTGGCTIEAGTASDFDALKVTGGIGFDGGSTGGPGATDRGEETPGGGTSDQDAGPTGGDSGGDTPASPGSIKALQLQAEEAGCDPDGIESVATGVSIAAAVVTSQEFSASSTELRGYYAMDEGAGPWSGILLVFDSDANAALSPGDLIDATGTLEEAWCGTQLRVDSWEVVGQVAPPEPVPLDADSVADWEPWENVLVVLEGVSVLEHFTHNPNKGQYLLEGGIYANFDFAFGTEWFLTLDVGATYDLAGPLRYSFDAYRINPRSQADVGLLDRGGDTGGDTGGGDTPRPPELTTISELQSSDASASCAGDEIETITSDLTVEGVLTVKGHQVEADLIAYALSDGTGGPNSGVELVVGIAQAEQWPVGEVLRITGSHTEFYCLTQLQADSVVVSDAELVVPPPHVLDDLMDAPEPWEGVVVEVHEVTVIDTSDWATFGQVTTDKGFLVDRSILGPSGLPMPAEGTTWSTLRGLVTYGFGAYRVAPRTLDDLVEAEP